MKFAILGIIGAGLVFAQPQVNPFPPSSKLVPGALTSGTVTSATIAPGVGIGTSGTCTITSTGTCTVSSNALTRECVFPTGGGTCLVTHSLNTTSPVISVATNSGGCPTETIGTFTANTFTVTNNVAQDCTYSISYAPSNVASFGISAAVINSTAARGGAGATYTITATPGSGYSGTITASATSFVTVGAGVTCPNVTLTSGGSWTGTMTCTASGGAFKGSGTFIVSATDSLTTQVTPTVALTVYDGVSLDGTPTVSSISSPCTTCTGPTVVTVAGDALFITVGYCGAAGCSSVCNSTSGNISVTDTGSADTFTLITAANTSPNACSNTFYAANLVGGSRTITIHSITNPAYYGVVFSHMFSKANSVTPLDTSVTKPGTGSGTSLSVTSAGNVTNLGEYIFADVFSNGTITPSGSFSVVAGSGGAGGTIVGYANPPSGSGVTFTATQSPGQVINIPMIGVTP